MADDRVTPDQELSAEELHRVWQGRLLLARKHLETYGNTEGRWKDNVKALAGDFNSLDELGEEAIDVNMVRSSIKSSLPPLYVTMPRITVTPTVETLPNGANNVENSRFTELEINYWIRELETRNAVKEIIYDGELTNVGYAYVGWCRSEDVKVGGEPVEYSDTKKPVRPFVVRLSPMNVSVPPGYRNLNEMPWVSVMFTQTLVHVQRKFGKAADDVPTRDYRGEWDQKDLSDSMRTYLESPDAKLVDVHNIWDKETRKVYISVVDHENFLEDPKAWPWDVEGLPIERYQPEHISDEYYGTPAVSYSLPQNKELNATRTAMRKNRNRTKQVVFASGDMADLADKYAAADDGAVITVDTQGEDIRTKLMIVPVQLDQGDIIYDSVIKGDVRESHGLGAERRGVGDPNVDSATASANIEKGTQIRESDKSDSVRGLWIGIARKFWMILKQHPNIERTRLIAGNNAGEYQKVEYTLKQIHGEFDFKMDLGAMAVITPAERMARARINYNLLRADPLVNPERLILDLLDANQTVDPSSYLLDLRQPPEEHQAMQSGLPVQAHERDDHIAHLQQHTAQEDQWNDALMQLGMAGELSPEQETIQLKLQMAQTLLIAHRQDHMRIVQQIQGNSQSAGSPVAQNLLRNDSAVQDGSETEAELQGQPLTSVQ